MEQNLQLIYAYKVKRAYERMCQPLCNQIGLPRTAFDILMFLGNHPTLNAAKDIVEIRGLKANHVSINVERLVNDGYLQRKEDTKDRRRMILLCTDKAGPILAEGREMQRLFYEKLSKGISHESLESFKATMMKIIDNTEEI